MTQDKPYELDENGILKDEVARLLYEDTLGKKAKVNWKAVDEKEKRRLLKKAETYISLILSGAARAEASARVLDEGKLREILAKFKYRQTYDELSDPSAVCVVSTISEILNSAVNIKDVQREEREIIHSKLMEICPIEKEEKYKCPRCVRQIMDEYLKQPEAQGEGEE